MSSQRKPNQQVWDWWQEQKSRILFEKDNPNDSSSGDHVVLSFRDDLDRGKIGPEEIIVNRKWLRIKGKCSCGSVGFAYDLTITNTNGKYYCTKCRKQSV